MLRRIAAGRLFALPERRARRQRLEGEGGSELRLHPHPRVCPGAGMKLCASGLR